MVGVNLKSDSCVKHKTYIKKIQVFKKCCMSWVKEVKKYKLPVIK